MDKPRSSSHVTALRDDAVLRRVRYLGRARDGLGEWQLQRCLRKSLLLSSVRSKVSSDSDPQVIIMRVLPAVRAEARSCGQDKSFCFKALE